MIDLELQGQIELKSQNLPHFELFRVISHHKLKSVFPNFGQKCILALLRSLLIWAGLTLMFCFIFNLKPVYFTKICVSLFICVDLYIFSETIASECCTFHTAPHIYTDSFMHADNVAPSCLRVFRVSLNHFNQYLS